LPYSTRDFHRKCAADGAPGTVFFPVIYARFAAIFSAAETLGKQVLLDLVEERLVTDYTGQPFSL
jgi:hypothetical protein